MAVELHLPDLPEVPLALGGNGQPPRPRTLAWHLRLRELLSSYLPLLLMALLALGSWWLVKNTPTVPAPREQEAVRTEPDYTMTKFALDRFEAGGRPKLRIEGDRLRHFPDTDRIEIDQIRLAAYAPDGRVTHARARRALSNGDGSEVQLIGAAEVDSVDAKGVALSMRSEFLHVYTVAERVRTHLPVAVQRNGSEIRAAGMAYDHGLARLDLVGPMRATLPPRAPANQR
jgi:lipopolysaccharide export system protein LptC